ncbi:MAG: sensor histidine kinase [bacterium]
MPETLRVLLIEDDVVDCEVVRRLLEGLALVAPAETGIEGVEAFGSDPPDLVLLSTRLPDADSLEVLAQILSDERKVPVMMLAAAGDEEIVELGLSVGAAGWVPKSALSEQSLRLGVLFALRGATRQRELERQRHELEHAVAGLAKDFGTVLQQIARRGGALRERLAGRLDGAAAADLAFIRDQALEMASFADDLAEYASGETGRGEAAWVDLNETIRVTLEELREAVASSQARIEVEALPTVWGDAPALAHLFRNLFLHSMSSRGHAPVAIRVSAHPEGNGWEIRVEDDGPGNDPRKTPSEGLGLATCARIVERHGGRIRLRSKPGQGSIFRFTLKAPPVADPPRLVDGSSAAA